MLYTIPQVAGTLLSRVTWALLKLLVVCVCAFVSGWWSWSVERATVHSDEIDDDVCAVMFMCVCSCTSCSVITPVWCWSVDQESVKPAASSRWWRHSVWLTLAREALQQSIANLVSTPCLWALISCLAASVLRPVTGLMASFLCCCDALPVQSTEVSCRAVPRLHDEANMRQT